MTKLAVSDIRVDLSVRVYMKITRTAIDPSFAERTSAGRSRLGSFSLWSDLSKAFLQIPVDFQELLHPYTVHLKCVSIQVHTMQAG